MQSVRTKAGRRLSDLDSGMSTRSLEIRRITATVHGERTYHDALDEREGDRKQPRPFAVRTHPGARRPGLRIVLSAVLGDGRTITADGSFGISGSSKVRSRSDVREQIDQMLGRSPQMRHPPLLAWGPLMSALQSACVASSEPELIARPLEIRYDPSSADAVAPGFSPADR